MTPSGVHLFAGAGEVSITLSLCPPGKLGGWEKVSEARRTHVHLNVFVIKKSCVSLGVRACADVLIAANTSACRNTSSRAA